MSIHHTVVASPLVPFNMFGIATHFISPPGSTHKNKGKVYIAA